MKVTKTTIEDVEINVSFPSYWKALDWIYYKIIDEKSALAVYDYPFEYMGGIEFTQTDVCFSHNPTEITEVEFSEAYVRQLDCLNNAL